MEDSSKPIGIFDSGVGGLTVYRAVRHRLPNEKIIYLGDTARVPYGTKSLATVQRYALENSEFLITKEIKILIVACNTASALAVDLLRQKINVPVFGVIEPGAKRAVEATKNGRIGVIATEATIESGAYSRAIHRFDNKLQVISRACPLFVPLAEEGEIDSDITRAVAAKYLGPLKRESIDTLVLGCTHYPILKPIISEVMGDDVKLIDSAEAVAAEVAGALSELGLARAGNSGWGREGSPSRDEWFNTRFEDAPPTSAFFVTDSARRFCKVAERFLGEKVDNHIEEVEIWGHDELYAH